MSRWWIAAALAGAVAGPAHGAPQSTAMASVSTGGVQGNLDCVWLHVSADGNRIVFQTASSTLVPGDTNGTHDIFVRTVDTATTTRVSVDASGNEANGWSQAPRISTDGKYVVFESAASNLAPGDTNGWSDVFLKDLVTGAITRVSVSSSGAPANGPSQRSAVSGDGRFVSFSSYADNLVPGDTNGTWDVFVHDTFSGVTTRASVSSTGLQADDWTFSSGISADGRIVVFHGPASNLVPGDTNGTWDVFVHDRDSGVTSFVSVSSQGVLGTGESKSPEISADGRFVVFGSEATNLVPGDLNWHGPLSPGADIFVRDRVKNTTVRVSLDAAGNEVHHSSRDGEISPDGRWVSFRSPSPDLVPGDANGIEDVFLKDTLTGAIELASVSSTGVHGNGKSAFSAVAAGGQYVAFLSSADNLARPDNNGRSDIFLRDRTLQPPVTYCKAKTHSAGCAATMVWAGTPSATAPAAFDVAATGVINNKVGLLFYGFGPNSAPFQGGTRCVLSPTRRTPLQVSGGNPPPADCSGAFGFDFNARIQSGVDPSLAPGVVVYGQYWYRDPLASHTTGLTNGLSFVIGP